MQDIINHSGYINVNRTYNCTKGKGINAEYGLESPSLNMDRHYAYDFNNGDLVIHAFENVPEIDGDNKVLGYSYENTPYLFCSQLPININEFSLYPQNFHHKIDFVVKGYREGTSYREAYFQFDELQYFCSSRSIVSEDDKSNIVFSKEQGIIKSFTINIKDVPCEFSFIVGAKGKWRHAHSNMEAVTSIKVVFPETNDLGFLNAIYLIVDCAFSFICNRRNTTCISMKLIGECPSKTINNGKVVDCIQTCSSEIFYFNRYREDSEDKRTIAKTWEAAGLLEHIDNLLQMIANDLNKDVDESGFISIASIHPSVKRRNLIDLQQSLQITGAFEFYIRQYLPDMVEEKDHHIIMKMILEELASKQKGKLKELAKSLARNVVREPALEDKVWKAYKGFHNWNPLKPCLSEEWFQEEEIKKLGHEVNQWRNDLAHSKRSYEPKLDTIRAVRLLEHMNYAIVLREIGYSDSEIQELLRCVLKR